MAAQNEAMLEAYASCPPEQKIYCTVVVNHPSFASPAYLVANVADDMDFGIEVGTDTHSGETVTHTAIPFQVDYPEQREGQAPQSKVTIDNVNRELVPQIRAAMGVRAYITITYREYVGSDLANPAYGPMEFVLANVTMVASTLTGTIMVKNLQNKRFPKQSKNYTPTQFRSLLPG